MNNIQEKDWAEDDWHGHTGMDSSCDYCIVPQETGTVPDEDAAEEADDQDNG